MNFWEFTLELLHAIAWPCTVIAGVFLLRQEIRSLLPRVTRLKAWGVEAELEKAAEAIVEDFPKAFTEESCPNPSFDSAMITAPLTTKQKRTLKNLITHSLNRIERLVVIFYYYEEFSYTTIAASLRISEDEVRRIHQSVLEKLKASLSILGDEDSETDV